MAYFDIESTYAKVDFSPMAVGYLDAVIERSSPDSFHDGQRDRAVAIAKEFGDEPYDGRFDPEYDD